MHRHISSELSIPVFAFDFNDIYKSVYLLKQLILEKRYDVVHSHGINSSLFVVISTLGNKFVNRIVTIHGDAEFDRLEKNVVIRKMFSYLEVFLSLFNKRYIVVSKDLKRRLINKHINKNKLIVVNNGVEIYSANNNSDTKNLFSVCCIGRLEPVKGHLVLIKALKHYLDSGNEKNICIDIYGEGSDRSDLEKYIKNNKLEKNVKLYGNIENAKYLIHNYDVYVQPSQYETFGISLIEAMVEQTPIIASDVGGISEIITNNYNGLLFEEGNYKELSNLLLLLKNDESLRFILKENALECVKKKYNIQMLIKKLERIYDNFGESDNG